MLLQRLKEYADNRLKLPPTLYSETAVRYIIELDATGRAVGLIDTADAGSSRTKRGQRYVMPQITRSVGIKPLLLADNAEYTLGLAREASKPERVAACHRAYLALLERCAAATQEPAVEAVRRFLQNDPGAQLHLPDDFDRSALITFRVNGQFPTDLPAVQAFWATENDPAARDATVMQCLVCGEERPVLERLQGKIKGVPGGQTSGTSIISANNNAFESYGLEASLIAPTCSQCGERFTKAANDLLANEHSRMVIGNAAFIFWTREPVEFNFLTVLTDPESTDARRMFESLFKGGGVPTIDNTAFYATVLSGSGGRAVVRDWIDTTIGEAKRNLARWFERQAIVGYGGDEPRPLSIYALAGATVLKMADLPPTTTRALLRAALVGTPLPTGLLYQAVRRNRAEQKVTRQRAALIKLVLLSRRSPTTEARMVKLDPDHPSPGYQCGRLLAVLEEAQRLAVPGINATIVDRFFGTASATPIAVFPRLVRGAQPHLSKLKRDRRGAYEALQQRMEEIQGHLRNYPATLTLEEQGLFALGYYHQRAYDRAQAAAASERKKAATRPQNAAPDTSDETNDQLQFDL